MEWRNMEEKDIPFVYELANRIHTGLHEDMDVFIERLSLSPEGCYVLQDKTIVGYCISHPYLKNESPTLNTLIQKLPETPDCWYIHDMAILPEYRGKGAATCLLAKIKHLAVKHGINEVSLTSVNNSESFWIHCGFSIVPYILCPSYGSSIFMKMYIHLI